MRKTPRHLAVDILNSVFQGRAFAADVLDSHLERQALSGTADGRLLTHLVYGVLRMRGHLDWILARLYRGDFARMEESVRNILRTGLYQLKLSDRLPAYAVVDESVKIAKQESPAAGGLVNAVLRGYLRNADQVFFPSSRENPAEYIAAFHSHPLWLVKIWLNLFGQDETQALCRANNETPPVTVRVNTLKISRNVLEHTLAAEAFASSPTTFSPDGLLLADAPKPVARTRFFQDGLLRIQDEAAQMISHLAAPRAGESVLDACAGSGGKTTHLAALMKNEGRIAALDCDADKILQLKQEAARLGVTNIETFRADLTRALDSVFTEKFNRVLVDAPCSGTGTLRRNPEIKWRLSESDLQILSQTQVDILHHASNAVQKGGLLIYSTCSLLPFENDETLRRFLREHLDFTPEANGGNLPAGLTDHRGFLRTYPHRHAMDGFFAAVLRRRN